jgi:inhibitor of cysteine peptidase
MQEIKLKTTKFKPFFISLSENPTTGYKWNIAFTTGIKMIQTIFDDAPIPGYTGKIPGAGGIRRWLFVNTSEIPQRITFNYQRPWEKNPVQKVVYYVHL